MESRLLLDYSRWRTHFYLEAIHTEAGNAKAVGVAIHRHLNATHSRWRIPRRLLKIASSPKIEQDRDYFWNLV